MPASYHIYPDLAFVHTVAYGALRGPEMLAHARALSADPAFSPAYSQLTDFRPATALEIRGEDIRRLVRLNPFSRAARRVALVDADYVYGLLRMYQILADVEEANTLVTLSEAEAWAFLALRPEEVRGPAASRWDSEDGAPNEPAAP